MKRARLCVAVLLASTVALCQSPTSPPPNGPRAINVGWSVVTGATIHASPDVAAARGALEIRDGRIVRVIPEGAEIPAGARVHDRSGFHVYAGFLDPYVEVEAPAPDRNGPGVHWNARVTPQRSVLDGAGCDAATRTQLRKLGFAAAAISPKGGIFRGRAAVVSLADPPANQPLGPLDPYKVDVFSAVGFDTAGARTEGPPREAAPEDVARWERYPSSLMGAIAVVRQTLADAAWHHALGSAGDPRFIPNCLDALAPGDASPPLLFDASDELDVLRAAKIAKESSRRAIILGSGYEFRRLPAVAAIAMPLVVPLATPERPRVSSVGEAESVDLRELMTWEQAPTNLRRLNATPLTVALTSSKTRNRAKFLDNLREAIRHGLPEDAALAMLTTRPASILGMAGRLGAIAPGSYANLVVSDGPIFGKDSKILEVWIDGRVHEVNAPSGSARGDWTVSADPVTANDIKISIGRTDRVRVHVGGAAKRAREARVTSDRITMVTDLPVQEGVSGNATWTGIIEGATMSGSGFFANGTPFRWTATRVPGSETRATADREGQDDGPASRPESRPSEDNPAVVPEAFGLPFGPYALDKPPEQPDTVLFAGATVWTSGPAGTIEGGYVLVERGKIVSVGTARPPLPDGAVVVDVAGKHVTPGLIDCHSHTGISRGVNEGGQAVSAEVRIADVTDPDSIHWYRALAGGLTAANCLHGSSNTIGGQNCVVKLRWGVAHQDEMHLEGAAPGIKFALGENPKQSNAGDRSTSRYPQTRMGVEALIRDRFTAAREYAAAARAGGGSNRVPERRDLELEALAEILAGERLVHCHSYRQDEILMLCRIAKEFGFTIGTFQHVLEGYKVADEIKAAALGASSFSDWWAYKVEVQDAIPQSGPIMHDVGVVVSYNSDSDELARRMNIEAAKAVKYGGLPKAEALKFVTLNPAKQLRIDARVGSLERGKDADLVVWSDDPLSTRARCEQTWIDGRRYFSLESDAAARVVIAAERQRLLQKALEASRGGRGDDPGGGEPTAGDEDTPGRRRGRPGDADGYRGGAEDFMRPGDCGCGEHEEDWR